MPLDALERWRQNQFPAVQSPLGPVMDILSISVRESKTVDYNRIRCSVGCWLYWGLRHLSVITAISRLGRFQSLKFKWRGGESNPGPLAPEAKSLTTRPPPLPIRCSEKSKVIEMSNSTLKTWSTFDGTKDIRQ